jgi:alanyl-tRNA synthetase
MQQHTGQHLAVGCVRPSVRRQDRQLHLGTDVSTTTSREVTAREIAAAEDEANVSSGKIGCDDQIRKPEEAARLPLRKEPASGTLRIDIEAFDLSACGGTHVSRTGAIGVIGEGERFGDTA